MSKDTPQSANLRSLRLNRFLSKDDQMVDLVLKNKLNALCEAWEQGDYKLVNPDEVRQQLKEIFQNASWDDAKEAMADLLDDLKSRGKPRLAQRINLGYQSL